jgi:amino acid permease
MHGTTVKILLYKFINPLFIISIVVVVIIVILVYFINVRSQIP